MNTKNNSFNSVLVISAHADDHIACAGTLFKLKDRGWQLYEVVLTTSGEGRDYRDINNSQKVEELRDKELSKASQFLGSKKIYRLDQEDLSLRYSKDLVFRIVPIIRGIKPKIGIIHNGFDWHPDHREAFRVSSEAFKLAATGIKPELGEAWRTSIVLAAEGMLPIKPKILVDVTDYVDKKMQLWQIYESQAQFKAINFEKSLMSVRGYHLRRTDSLMAEAFTIDPTSPIILFD